MRSLPPSVGFRPQPPDHINETHAAMQSTPKTTSQLHGSSLKWGSRLGSPFGRQRMMLEEAVGTRKHSGVSLGCPNAKRLAAGTKYAAEAACPTLRTPPDLRCNSIKN